VVYSGVQWCTVVYSGGLWCTVCTAVYRVVCAHIRSDALSEGVWTAQMPYLGCLRGSDALSEGVWTAQMPYLGVSERLR